MACKYVKDFSFPADQGFTGSAGVQQVKGYARGGPVVKKSLGGIIKAISPLAAIVSGDAPKGIGALGGVGGILLESALRKKKLGQPLTPQETQATASAPAPAMKRGGAVKVHSAKPLIGK